MTKEVRERTITLTQTLIHSHFTFHNKKNILLSFCKRERKSESDRKGVNERKREREKGERRKLNQCHNPTSL